VRHVTHIWWEKPEEKKPLGRQRNRWQNNFKMSYRSRLEVDWVNIRIVTSGRHLQTQ